MSGEAMGEVMEECFAGHAAGDAGGFQSNGHAGFLPD